MKALIIKIFARMNFWFGFLLRRKRISYSPDEIKTILVKRTDRIGDAVVSLPLLLELSKCFKVTILTSQYNDFLLREFFETRIFTEKPLGFSQSVKMIINSFFMHREKKINNVPQYDLFLDLNGLRELDIFLKIKRLNLCKYYASFNMGAWSRLLDYAHSGYPALFTKKHVLISCKELVKNALGVDINIPDFVDLSDKVKKLDDFDKKNFVLVNISGSDKFRGPSPKAYAEIINAINFDGEFIIMDELGQPNLSEFKKYVKRNNIVYLVKDYSIWELLYIASQSKLYIGADSGISHLLHIPVNAIIFFGSGDHLVWRPYSVNFYEEHKRSGIVTEKTINSKGLIKKIIYQSVGCRPCFDFGCRKALCICFSQDLIVDELNLIIKELFE